MNSKRMRKRIEALIFAVVLIFSALVTTSFASDQPSDIGDQDYTVTIIKHATENSDGLREYKYANGKTYTEVIPATGHVWGPWSVKKAATCTNSGRAVRKCIKHKEFTHYQYKAIPARGHDWGDWIVDKKPTSSTDGLEHRYCKNDASHIEYQSMPVIPQSQITVGTNIISNTPLTPKDKSKVTTNRKINTVSGTAGDGAERNKNVPIGATDVAIAGANGFAVGFFVLLLLPLVRVLLWVKKKRREAEEDQ